MPAAGFQEMDVTPPFLGFCLFRAGLEGGGPARYLEPAARRRVSVATPKKGSRKAASVATRKLPGSWRVAPGYTTIY